MRGGEGQGMPEQFGLYPPFSAGSSRPNPTRSLSLSVTTGVGCVLEEENAGALRAALAGEPQSPPLSLLPLSTLPPPPPPLPLLLENVFLLLPPRCSQCRRPSRWS